MRFESIKELWHMFFLHEERTVYRRIFIIRTVGNILIISAIIFVFSQFYPVIAAESQYNWNKTFSQNSPIASSLTQSTLSTQLPGIDTPSTKILPALSAEPIDSNFGLFIEKISANANVISEVDPFNQNEYNQALKVGVAHAKGTVFPGEIGNSYLFAHNTLNAWDIPKYNAIFYLLHNLEIGDRIATFYKQKRFDYIVFDKNIHSANDLSPLETKYSEPVLSLQTCWPPGTTWKRLVVRAKLDQ